MRARVVPVGLASVHADMACVGEAGAQGYPRGQYRRAAPFFLLRKFVTSFEAQQSL